MSEINDEILKGLYDIAQGLNDEYASARDEFDTGYFPPNTYSTCLPVFLEDVGEAFPSEEFDEDELTDIFGEIWTGWRE